MRLGAADVAELLALVAGAQGGTALRRLARGPARPGWSWRTELAAAAIRAILMRSKRRGIAWLRAVQAMQPVRSPALHQVRLTPVDAGGVPAVWCEPPGEVRRTLVYLHGGGYVIGSVEGYRDALARLALGAQARVLGVEYRLAPEHRFPAAHDDCLAAVRWALGPGGAAAERTAIAGDSAGGALAIATLCALRDAGDPRPAAGVLLCPWTDPLADGGSMVRNADVDFADRELLVDWVHEYAGPDVPRDPRLFPVEARLEGLPPLLVQVGGAEIVLDQVRAFVERAEKAGVEVRLEEHAEMFHDWQMLASLLPEGASALDAVAAFVRERLPA